MQSYIFPGQGSQKVGMGKDLYEAFPEAREAYLRAKAITQTDWAAISFEADKDTLSKTQFTQPCLFLNSAAILASLGDNARFDGVAGHSLGEYSALFAASVLTFDDAFSCVVERGRLMSAAKSGGMLAPLGANDEGVFTVVETLSAEGVLVVANRNAPGQMIVSGEEGLLDKAAAALVEIAGAKKVLRLPVSGAFHSPLMREAGETMAEILSKIPFTEPKVSFYANVSGTREGDPNRIRKLLVEQITNPVLWINQIKAMSEDGFDTFVEIGPGSVLQNLVSRIVPDAKIRGISTAESVHAERSGE